jgi:hypothetical protein
MALSAERASRRGTDSGHEPRSLDHREQLPLRHRLELRRRSKSNQQGPWTRKHHPAAPFRGLHHQIQRRADRRGEDARAEPEYPPGLGLSKNDEKRVPPCALLKPDRTNSPWLGDRGACLSSLVHLYYKAILSEDSAQASLTGG